TCGWFLSQPDRFPWIYKILVPAYPRAVQGLQVLAREGTQLVKGDPGFAEIASIMRDYLEGTNIPEVSGIRTLSVFNKSASTPQGAAMLACHNLEISFVTGDTVNGEICELREKIEKRFLTSSLFYWSSAIFWSGIVVM